MLAEDLRRRKFVPAPAEAGWSEVPLTFATAHDTTE